MRNMVDSARSINFYHCKGKIGWNDRICSLVRCPWAKLFDQFKKKNVFIALYKQKASLLIGWLYYKWAWNPYSLMPCCIYLDILSKITIKPLEMSTWSPVRVKRYGKHPANEMAGYNSGLNEPNKMKNVTK